MMRLERSECLTAELGGVCALTLGKKKASQNGYLSISILSKGWEAQGLLNIRGKD